MEVCKGLIEESPDTLPPAALPGPTASDSDPMTPSLVLLGYPDYPLYKRLSDSTAYLMVTG